jgi:hypothetical protein
MIPHTPMPCPELVTLEIARLVETGTEWDRLFRRYDQLQDAGLSCEEAAQIVYPISWRENNQQKDAA